ncbi:hypothetical protein F5888DRAFT_630079 [Russula emetica]|nr:hypothetical protein F5888DRAFT_630079 [Russula emetica]
MPVASWAGRQLAPGLESCSSPTASAPMTPDPSTSWARILSIIHWKVASQLSKLLVLLLLCRGRESRDSCGPGVLSHSQVGLSPIWLRQTSRQRRSDTNAGAYPACCASLQKRKIGDGSVGNNIFLVLPMQGQRERLPAQSGITLGLHFTARFFW